MDTLRARSVSKRARSVSKHARQAKRQQNSPLKILVKSVVFFGGHASCTLRVQACAAGETPTKFPTENFGEISSFLRWTRFVHTPCASESKTKSKNPKTQARPRSVPSPSQVRPRSVPGPSQARPRPVSRHQKNFDPVRCRDLTLCAAGI